jgi:hypothetical protein
MSDCEKFQQRIFGEITELEGRDQTRIAADLVAIGKRAGVDVVVEVLDKGKTLAEVLDAIKFGLQISN